MTKVCPIIERACIDEHCWWFLNGCPAYPGSNPLRIHLREINRLLTEILAVLSYQNPELIVSEPLPAGHKCQFCEKDIESEPDNQGSLVFEG